MSDPITKHVFHILLKEKEVLVPLSDLHRRLLSEGMLLQIDPPMLEQMLREDSLFRVIHGIQDLKLLHLSAQAHLHNYNFINGPYVMLRLWDAYPPLVLHAVLRQMHDMNIVLEMAWKMKSDVDPAESEMLLHLLMVGDLLERELRQALSKQLPQHTSSAEDE